jgi:hypothetical protein
VPSTHPGVRGEERFDIADSTNAQSCLPRWMVRNTAKSRTADRADSVDPSARGRVTA